MTTMVAVIAAMMRPIVVPDSPEPGRRLTSTVVVVVELVEVVDGTVVVVVAATELVVGTVVDVDVTEVGGAVELEGAVVVVTCRPGGIATSATTMPKPSTIAEAFFIPHSFAVRNAPRQAPEVEETLQWPALVRWRDLDKRLF
jgi:hypothetical protein